MMNVTSYKSECHFCPKRKNDKNDIHASYLSVRSKRGCEGSKAVVLGQRPLTIVR
jgi:hypothetical protein